MSGGSSANNSWTILTPEETVADTLRPLADGKEHHEESLTSAAGSGEIQPASGAESAERLPVESHLVSEGQTAELNGDTSTEQHTSVSTAVADAPVPTPDSFVPGSDALNQSEGLPEGPAQSSPDPHSFSDSYTHVTPSLDEPPATLLTTETLGGVELTQEEERLTQEGALYTLNGKGLQQEGEESDLSPRATDIGKQADSPVVSEVGEDRPQKTGEKEEPELRRRRSLLAALEQIGRTEEEEEREEEFQLPRREEDSGFSVNKCILGAVILLGLGTIFFSESDYGTRELKDAELPGKEGWLNLDVPPPPVDADSTELLNKFAKGNEQISVLQAQLQAQKEELKVAKGQAAEGAKDRLLWEEVEKENSRLKKEMASLPVLQKENERMKRELESVPVLQKELESLRSTVTELKHSLSAAGDAPVKYISLPSSGQPEDSMQGTAGSTERQPGKPWDSQREKKKDMKKDKKHTRKEESEWKEREKRRHKNGVKTEWKKGKHEQEKFDKEREKEGKQKRHSDDTKPWEEKDWKKGKASRGDEGKPWKDREGKKEWIEKRERKELKEGKGWKKAKHEKVNEGKQWSAKEQKDWKVGKEHGEKHKSKEEWKGEKEWKKGKAGYKDGSKEKWEKKDWKEKGEKKEWKREGNWKSKNEKEHNKEGKLKGERKQWEESKDHGKERKWQDERKEWNENERKSKNGNNKEWKRKDERKHWEKSDRGQKEKKHNGDRNKDRSSSQDEHKYTGNPSHKEEHLWGDRKLSHTHHRPTMEQPEYWVHQRDRLQHNPKPPQHCNSLETCAQAEGLLPVPIHEFQAILQTYLAKAEEVGVDASKTDELRKLATEFFEDGVFVHEQMSFQDFVEDLGDVLEDMVEGNDNVEEEDSDIEEEMEGFERKVMKKFSVPGAGEKEERSKGEWWKESVRGRG